MRALLAADASSGFWDPRPGFSAGDFVRDDLAAGDLDLALSWADSDLDFLGGAGDLDFFARGDLDRDFF